MAFDDTVPSSKASEQLASAQQRYRAEIKAPPCGNSCQRWKRVLGSQSAELLRLTQLQRRPRLSRQGADKRPCRAAVSSAMDITPGGGERYLLEAAIVFQRLSCEVTLLLFEPNQCTGGDCVNRTAFMLGLRNLDVDAIKVASLNVQRHPKRPVRGLHGSAERLIRRDFDIFFFLGNDRAPRTPGLGRLNLYMCQFPFDWYRDMYPFEERNLATYDHVLLNSNFTMDWYSVVLRSQLRKPCAPTPVLLYPPVPAAEPRTPLFGAFSRRPFRIVIVGRIFGGVQSKGHYEAVRLFSELQTLARRDGHAWHAQLELYIVGAVITGKEHYARGLPELVTRLGLTGVHFVFDAPRRRLEALVEGARVIWSLTGFGQLKQMTNPADTEHFGIAVAEAMSAGCIPVLLNVGGLPEQVPSSAVGRVASTLEDVPTATLQVLSLPEAEMEAMSGQARAAAERFTGDMFERQLGSLVHEAKPKQRACYSANASAPTRFG